jgi:hypothetical protein
MLLCGAAGCMLLARLLICCAAAATPGSWPRLKCNWRMLHARLLTCCVAVCCCCRQLAEAEQRVEHVACETADSLCAAAAGSWLMLRSEWSALRWRADQHGLATQQKKSTTVGTDQQQRQAAGVHLSSVKVGCSNACVASQSGNCLQA